MNPEQPAGGLVLLASEAPGAATSATIADAAALLGRHASVEVHRCEDRGDLERVLDALDGRRLELAGGDGTVHLAVERLRARGAEELAAADLALLPLGTGNDLARTLGIPLDDVAAAAHVAACGVRRPLDLLVSDHGDVVVNAAHAGIGAEAAKAAEGLKDRLGAVAYPLGALLAGARMDPFAVQVAVDGAVVHDGPALMVGVANAPTVGGGTPLVPGADPADGLLDVLVVADGGLVDRVGFGAALRAGDHVGRDGVLVARGRTAAITGEAVRHDVDGEVSAPRTATTYEVVPRAWSLRSPA